MLTDPVDLNPVKDPKYFKTITVAEGARQEICFKLFDERGQCISLADRSLVQNDPNCAVVDGPDAANPGFSDHVYPRDAWPDVSIKLVISPGYGLKPICTIEGTILDYREARVVFHLEPEHLDVAGVYTAEIGLFRGELLLKRWPVYVCVEPSLFSKTQHASEAGIITIPEIRLALRDLDPSYNDVIEECEFKDAEIMHCIQKPVDMWNEMLPIEPALQFPYARFPFRGNWLRATCGYLLELASHWYRRNDVPISAGGISVADRNKHASYEPKAQQLIQEYLMWAKQMKASLNMRLAFGSIQSPWPRRNTWK